MFTNIIIDFDSTIVSVETLDLIAKRRSPADLEEISRITKLAMEGKLGFQEALNKRLGILKPSKLELDEIADELTQYISKSILENKSFFEKNREKIWICSGGFTSAIIPSAKAIGLLDTNILANDIIFDNSGEFITVNLNNPLSKNQGKITAIKDLNLTGKILMIGDGATDLEVKKADVADSFFYYSEHVYRESVAIQADKIIKSFNEIIELL